MEKKVEFSDHHFRDLGKFLSYNPKCKFFSLLYNKIKFGSYVGVIQVKNLNIEVLPKTDRDDLNANDWQNILLEMLSVSMKTRAKTSTTSDINTRSLTVLDAYIYSFLDQTERIVHEGICKKYRFNEGNKTTIKGRIVFEKQLKLNISHGERFYVKHQAFDSNNVPNSLIKSALTCILSISSTPKIRQKTALLLQNFIYCEDLLDPIRSLSLVVYNRKTFRYKPALSLARLILLNFHPDLKAGNSNVLALMVDMNNLWETYIFQSISAASKMSIYAIEVEDQEEKIFWTSIDGFHTSLRPDIIINYNNKRYIIDTKWKHQNALSSADLRQMFTYSEFWDADSSFLVFPEKLGNSVKLQNGKFKSLDHLKEQKLRTCALLYVDLINQEKQLDRNIGEKILQKILST